MIGEGINGFEWIAMLCSFAGIIMIISSKSKDDQATDVTS
jgi:hypothetical protein